MMPRTSANVLPSLMYSFTITSRNSSQGFVIIVTIHGLYGIRLDVPMNGLSELQVSEVSRESFGSQSEVSLMGMGIVPSGHIKYAFREKKG